MENDEKYLSDIVLPLVSKPINVSRKVDERGVYLELKVDKEDMGRIIGKGGETVNSIRALLRQFGRSREKVISLRVIEPEGSTYQPKKERYHSLDDLQSELK